MLLFSIFFLFAAMIAGYLGFTGIAGMSAGITKILSFLFLTGFVISHATIQSQKNKKI